MKAKAITLKVTVSEENVQALIDQYKEETGKLPTRKWVMDFLKSDVDYMYNETFQDELSNAVGESILEDDDEE